MDSNTINTYIRKEAERVTLGAPLDKEDSYSRVEGSWKEVAPLPSVAFFGFQPNLSIVVVSTYLPFHPI